MSKPTNDLAMAFKERDNVTRWMAEGENATTRLEMAQLKERLWLILSQHEPVASLGLDRDKLRIVLDFIRTGRVDLDWAIKFKEGLVK